MEPSHCHACATELDPEDNFCRRCGAPTDGTRLPAVRQPAGMTVWQPHVPPVVKGAAVMAAGTIGQFLIRRMASNLIGGGRARKPRALKVDRRQDGMVDEAQIITETVMMRRVRIRRQA
jgi:hypothetical protein